MSTARMPADPPAPPVEPVDSGLRCPKCEYNLTGLVENRCPECGAAFDPDVLRGRIDVVQPATPWEVKTGWSGFWSTWWLAAAEPARLARQFTARHRVAAARLFARINFVLAGLIIITPSMLGPPWRLLASILMAAVILVAILTYNHVLAIELGMYAPAQPRVDDRLRWQGIMCYFTVFLVLTTVPVSLMGHIDLVVSDSAVQSAVRMANACFAVLLYVSWLRAIAIAARVRSSRRGIGLRMALSAVFATLASGIFGVIVVAVAGGCLGTVLAVLL